MQNSKHEIIIQALLSCPTVKEASEKTKIPLQTIYNNLRNEEFKKKYNQAKAEALQQTTTYLQGKTAEAVAVVDEIAKDEFISPQIRLTACRTILEFALKYAEQGEILQRITALEEAQDSN